MLATSGADQCEMSRAGATTVQAEIEFGDIIWMV